VRREGRGRTREANGGGGGVPRGSVAGPWAAQEARRAAMGERGSVSFLGLLLGFRAVCGGGGAEESNGMGGVRKGLRWHVAAHAAAIPGQPAPN
jgi:hypothetical protein